MCRGSLITIVIGFLLGEAGCATDEPSIPDLVFPTDGSIENAWGRARTDPAAGVVTTFPTEAVGMADGTTVLLFAGRSSNGAGYPLTTGDDVIIADPHLLATSKVEDQRVEFPQLGVSTGTWTSESGTVPDYLLCGVTVIAARAYATTERAASQLAATWLVAVAPDCP